MWYAVIGSSYVPVIGGVHTCISGSWSFSSIMLHPVIGVILGVRWIHIPSLPKVGYASKAGVPYPYL